jgi:dGTPase
MLDFNTKINYQRHNDYVQDKTKKHYDIVRCFESDRGRILNSAAVRRLQQKTQVFPLERNAVVRTRLTHSLEVQQVGRFIIKEVLFRLQEKQQLALYGLAGNEAIIESMVEMACLMHDIGNPPFGHFGESAINQWFYQRLSLDKKSHYQILDISSSKQTKQNNLRRKIRYDLYHFEGNAQAIRLIHTLLKLNLTYSQVACILKYTRPAYWYQSIPQHYDYLMKKSGYYLSEEPFIESMQQQLHMSQFHRFPLTYVMEAADDISYCIADLEDAIEKKLFSVEQLYDYLCQVWGPKSKDDLFEQTVEPAYKEYQTLKEGALLPRAIDQFFVTLRVKTINKLVPHAAERFIENLPEIFHGNFNQALLEDKGSEYRLLTMFKQVSEKYIFNHESVEIIELQGYRIITGLLDIYSLLLAMSTEDFLLLVNKNNLKKYAIESRLFHRLPANYCVAYQQAIKAYVGSDDFDIWEFYYRCRLIQDYISGMTDHYAYDEYRKLMVAN